MKSENLLKRNRIKKSDVKIFVILLFVVAISIGMTVITDSLVATREARRRESFGFWHGAVFDANEDIVKSLAENKMVESMGNMYISGLICDEGDIQVGAVGYADEGLFQMNNIGLLDGRMPIEADEIAVEAALLNRLGYSYELNQRIEINIADVNQNGENKITSFRLCGVVKNYSGNWKSGAYNLISAFVTKEYNAGCKKTLRHAFVKLYDKYARYADDVNSLCLHRMVLNDFTYEIYSEEKSIFSDNSFLHLIILLSGFVILMVLINNEIIKRQSDFVTLRVLGATRTTIIGLFIKEKIIAFVLAICMGTALGVCASYLLFIALRLKWSDVVFSVEFYDILKQFVMQISGMILTLLFCFVRLFQIPLRGRAMQQGRKPKKISKRPLNANNIFSRFRISDRLKSFLSFVFSSVVFTLILIMGYQSFEQFKNYNYQIKNYPIDYEYGSLLLAGSIGDSDDKNFVERVQSSYGVGEVYSYLVSDFEEIIFSNGFDKDYISAAADNLGGYIDGINEKEGAYGCLIGISDGLDEVYLRQTEKGVSQKNLNDDEVILYLPDYVYKDSYFIPVDLWRDEPLAKEDIVKENTIKEGDIITYHHGNESYQLKIAGIIREQNEAFCYYVPNPYSIICTEECYKKIYGEEDVVYLLANHDDNAIGYQTDAELSKIKTTLYFQNMRSEMENERNNLIIQLALSLIICLSGIMFCVLARAGIATVTDEYEVSRYKTLYQLGMPISRIRFELTKGAILESACSCVVAFVVEIIWLGIKTISQLTEMDNGISGIDFIRSVLNIIVNDNEWLFIVVALVVCFAVNTGLAVMNNNKLIRI